MEQQFAHEYKLVLERSRDEAIRHHCNKIEPIHIFLALTHDSNSKPYKLIEALGNVPIDQLRSDIDTIAHSLSDNEIATTSIVASPLSERIIKLSALEAQYEAAQAMRGGIIPIDPRKEEAGEDGDYAAGISYHYLGGYHAHQ